MYKKQMPEVSGHLKTLAKVTAPPNEPKKRPYQEDKANMRNFFLSNGAPSYRRVERQHKPYSSPNAHKFKQGQYIPIQAKPPSQASFERFDTVERSPQIFSGISTGASINTLPGHPGDINSKDFRAALVEAEIQELLIKGVIAIDEIPSSTINRQVAALPYLYHSTEVLNILWATSFSAMATGLL